MKRELKPKFALYVALGVTSGRLISLLAFVKEGPRILLDCLLTGISAFCASWLLASLFNKFSRK